MTEDLQHRADFVIEFMKLGMDFSTACIASECSPEMVKILEEDEEFQHRKAFVLAKKEGELLERLNKASEFAAIKGDTRSTERLLEILKPERYAKSAKVTHEFDAKNPPKEVSISFVSGTSLANGEEEEPELVSAEG